MKKIELLFIFLFLLLDQGSKLLFTFFYQEPIVIIPHFFSLQFVKNTGAAWSLFSGQSFFLIGISVIALFLLVRLHSSILKHSWGWVAFCLFASGILGNLLDRLFLGSVRDFLSFTFGSYAFPIFNFADVFIVVGAMLLFIIELRKKI